MTSYTKILALALILFLATTVCADVMIGGFSIDPASPTIAGGITPDDVLVPGPAISIAGSSLGLADNFVGGIFDNLNALSFGRNPITREFISSVPLIFSVDRVAVGQPGSAVEAQSLLGDAAADIFRSPPPVGSNSLSVDGRRLGLVPGLFGDDLDALELQQQDTQFTYFSIDDFSATNDFGPPLNPDDIYADDILVSSGNGLFDVFADGITDMGLMLDELELFVDDVDALALFDGGTRGVLDPGIDVALFSLSTFSPSTFTFTGEEYMPGQRGQLSPADILFTDFTGDFSLFASAPQLGLRPDDEIDALARPEPSSVLIWTLCPIRVHVRITSSGVLGPLLATSSSRLMGSPGSRAWSFHTCTRSSTPPCSQRACLRAHERCCLPQSEQRRHTG